MRRVRMEGLVHWLIGRPFTLPAELLARYPELALARWRRDGLALRVGGWLLGRARVSGITLWRTIWIASDAALEPELLLHELRHVHQFQADTLFPMRYLWQSVTEGYLNNAFEVDARTYAAQRLGTEPPAA